MLTPSQTFQVEISVASNTPYKFNEGDLLVNTDEEVLFGVFEHIVVKGTVEGSVLRK